MEQTEPFRFGDDMASNDGSGASSQDAGTLPSADPSVCASAEIDVDVDLLVRPADIVWVIDSSGSMSNEAERIQEHMNSFAARFADANLDTQIIVISPTRFVSVPPPLGEDDARFYQVSVGVDSDEALNALVDNWDEYGHRLRANSLVHFIAVTDDESALTGACFLEEMEKLVGADREFRLHTISSEPLTIDGEPDPVETEIVRADTDNCWNLPKFGYAKACEGAAQPGLEYRKAARATGGLSISICTEDWTSVFDQLAGSIERVSSSGCQLALPEVPAGADFDPEKVVLKASVEGNARTVTRVSTKEQCDSGGWYYDNPENPSHLLLCPSTCDDLGTKGARLSLELGCAWILR